MEEGLKYQQFTISPENAQFIETREFDTIEVCRWFRMPPRKIGVLTQAQGWSTLEASNVEYVQETLMSWLVTWEQRLNVGLLRPGETPLLFTEHLVEALMRADTAARSAYYNQAITTGWMTRNEAREKENLSPLDGLDEPLVPVNQTKTAPASDAATTTGKPDASADAPSPEDQQRDAIFRPLVEEAALRMIRREVNAITRAAKKADFATWLDTFLAEEGPTFRAGMGTAIDSHTLACGGTPEQAGEYAAEITKQHIEKLRQAAEKPKS